MASATIVRLQVPDRDEAQRASHREAHPLCQRFGAARGYLLPHEERELNERLASAGSDIEVEISRSGATLYATSEKALRRAAARITGERWQHLRAGPHEARVLSDPAREAWMNVTVRCERGFAAAVRCELEARGAHVGSASFSRSHAVLAALAPLARLLAFEDWLARTTRGAGHAEAILAQWRIVEADPDPPLPPAA